MKTLRWGQRLLVAAPLASIVAVAGPGCTSEMCPASDANALYQENGADPEALGDCDEEKGGAPPEDADSRAAERVSPRTEPQTIEMDETENAPPAKGVGGRRANSRRAWIEPEGIIIRDDDLIKGEGVVPTGGNSGGGIKTIDTAAPENDDDNQ